jgi:site-specific recombinase XerD
MFDRLFKHPHALARHRNGPLSEERRRYLVHRAEQQMSAHTLQNIAAYILIVAKALRLADRSGELITRDEIETEADCWVSRKPKPPRMQKVRRSWLNFRSNAIRWLAFLGRLQPPDPVQRPYAEQITQFSDYMLRERGFSPQTIRQRCWTINNFLAQIDAAGLRLDKLTVAQVDELLVQNVRDQGYARKTIRTRVSALRSFFRLAEERGWCRPGLAVAIMAPRMFPHEGLPLGPSWVDVKRLLAAAQGDRRADIRDRAMLSLLAVYGLRAGEVVTLRLEDFDWEQELLIVPPGKRQRPRIYPLCRPVGDAVLRYLREVRPRSDRREVFFTLLAPFRPLSVAGLGDVVRHRLHALSVTLPHYGAHALRHACATHLLAKGLSLKEIGDHLGHRSPEATRLYAKVDLAGLRVVGDFDLEDLL